jgi:hypothetical protein
MCCQNLPVFVLLSQWVSEWLLFNTDSAIFQLYHGENKLISNEMLIRSTLFQTNMLSWIFNYLCNQCLSPLMLWVQTPLIWGVLNTTLCDDVCQWLERYCQYQLGDSDSVWHHNMMFNIDNIRFWKSWHTFSIISQVVLSDSLPY